MSQQDKTVAIMQPYLFPYIGYFQLIHAADTFVFYDDVNYIKQGWINRNRILINGKPSYLTASLQGASPNRLICDIALKDNRPLLIKSVEMAYRKAPFFADTIELVENVMTHPVQNISEWAMHSVTAVTDHLGVFRDYRISSREFAHTRSLPRADRLIAITKECGAAHYINAIGGRELYRKEYFSEQGVSLTFLKSRLQEYRQFGGDFQPGLSIIDVLMFNAREEVREMLSDYLRLLEHD